MNRAEATWELVKEDRVHAPGKADGLDLAQDAVVKGYDALSGIVPSALGFISNNDFEVIKRDSPIAATREAVRSTLKARWFKKGNPLNLAAKVVTGITELTDGAIQDVLHLGDSQHGSVIRTAA